MPNLMQKLREFLGSSCKTQIPIKTENKVNEYKNNEVEAIQFKEEKKMLDLNEFTQPYEEVSERDILSEKRPGEFLVELEPENAGDAPRYTGIRLNLTAIYETVDEYGYTKYYRVASHSDAYITDLSTVNFGTNATDEAGMARIRRVLAESRYTRTKLLFLNMLEVDSTGVPLGLDTLKVPVNVFMKRYKLFI